MLEEQYLMLVKEETEYGTDPTPTPAANAILVSKPSFKEVAALAERAGAGGSLSPLAAKLGSNSTELTFQTELKGSGSAGTAPRIGDLFEACGALETVSAGSSVTYSPASASFKSVTIYLYKATRLHKITGARGNAKLVMGANKQPMVEFSMKGLYTAPTTVTFPTTQDFEDTVAPVCKGETITLNGVGTLAIENTELDFGNNVALLPSKIAATGIGTCEITGRKPKLSVNPESVAIATLDIRALMLTTPVAYSEAIGATAGNIITVSVPKFNIEAPEYGEREGKTIETLKGSCCRSADAGNDEWRVTFS